MIPVICPLFAFILPAFVIVRNMRGKPLRRPYLCSVSSFIFCALAMLAELYTVKLRVNAGDVGGVLDTIDAVLMLCAVLVVVTAVLNLLALASSSSKVWKEN